MGAGASVQTKALDQVLLLAKADAGIGGTRAFQGYKRWAQSDNLNDLVLALTAETQGYFFCSLKSAGVNDATMADAPEDFVIVGELLVKIAKDTTSDLNSAWDFAIRLATELAKCSNYTAQTMGQPKSCRFALHDINVLEKGGILTFDFGRYGAGGITFEDP